MPATTIESQQLPSSASNYHRAPAITSKCHQLLTHDLLCDVELIDSIISDLKLGKAAGLDELTSEHLKLCHPALALILTKLFNIMLKCSQVPDNFGNSYTVPIPKGDYIHDRELKVDDFRGISICPIISKLFEKCILQQFEVFFNHPLTVNSDLNLVSVVLTLFTAFEKWSTITLTAALQ